jgi:hypothetical protein
LVWLAVGAIAAVQRHYDDKTAQTSCAHAGTVVVTILAGPLNYAGTNPTVHCQRRSPANYRRHHLCSNRQSRDARDHR